MRLDMPRLRTDKNGLKYGLCIRVPEADILLIVPTQVQSEGPMQSRETGQFIESISLTDNPTIVGLLP